MEQLTTNKEKSKPTGVVAQLQTLAQNSEVFRSMCHVFALRERTRSQITVMSLEQTMKKEGFSFTKEEYRQALTVLSDLHLGKLDRSARGKVRALKNITVTLQSLGLASLSNLDLQRRYEKPKYTKLPDIIPTVSKSIPTSLPKPIAHPIKKFPELKPNPVFKNNPRVKEIKNMAVIPVSKGKTTSLQLKVGNKTLTYDSFPEDKVAEIFALIDSLAGT